MIFAYIMRSKRNKGYSFVESFARDILLYLMSYPNAKDTLEGIVEWWLLQQDIERAATSVQASLTLLTKEGFLIVRLGPDNQKHYSVNPKRKAEIGRILQMESGKANTRF